MPVVHVAAARTGWDQPAAGPPRAEPDIGKLKQVMDDLRQRMNEAEAARADALKQVQALQSQLQVLQTKAAHTAMALTDANTLNEARQQEILTLQTALRERAEPARSAAPTRPNPTPLDPNAPPRRRGRPPKVRAALPLMDVPAAPTPLELIAATPLDPAPLDPTPVDPTPLAAEPALKRPRGRPPKLRPTFSEPAAEPQPVEWWLLPSPRATGRRRQSGRS